MATDEKLLMLQAEKLKICEQERMLYDQKKKEIADLAEWCGVLTLPIEEIKAGFYNLIKNYYK